MLIGRQIATEFGKFFDNVAMDAEGYRKRITRLVPDARRR
jgi:hypothetical protein